MSKGTPFQNDYHLTSHPSSVDPRATITIPKGMPRSADDLPKEIEGAQVMLVEKPAPVVKAYTRSYLATLSKEEFAAQQTDIDYAQDRNLIIDDITSKDVLEAQDRSSAASAQRMLSIIHARDTKLASDAVYRELSNARYELQAADANGDAYAKASLTQKIADLQQKAEAASAVAKEASDATQDSQSGNGGE